MDFLEVQILTSFGKPKKLRKGMYGGSLKWGFLVEMSKKCRIYIERV